MLKHVLKELIIIIMAVVLVSKNFSEKEDFNFS